MRAAAATLRRRGAEALAIIFINAYANPENERRALDAARAVWPNEHVSASHQVLPEIREFERASTTALNAYLQPVVGAYLAKIEGALAEDGFSGQFHIVQSNGGVMSTATARRLPVRTALSGPAAGVIAAAAIARAAGYDNVITCDLGGTSFDVSVIAGGKAVAGGAEPRYRLRPRHPHADDRDHDHRRRRRLDRRRSIAAACCRSARKAPARCRDRPATARATSGRR